MAPATHNKLNTPAHSAHPSLHSPPRDLAVSTRQTHITTLTRPPAALPHAAPCRWLTPAEAERDDAQVVLAEGVELAAALRVPQPHLAVGRAGGEVAAVRRERAARHVLLVRRRQVMQLLAETVPHLPGAAEVTNEAARAAGRSRKVTELAHRESEWICHLVNRIYELVKRLIVVVSKKSN